MRAVFITIMVAVVFACGLVIAPTASAGKVQAQALIWNIYVNGKPVKWVAHKPNPRFVIYDPNGNSDPSNVDTLRDDLVLDLETGLVWTRDANPYSFKWFWSFAISFARQTDKGGRRGWRLPTVDEMASLFNASGLPAGHPFVNLGMDYYWTSTTQEDNSYDAWIANPNTGTVSWHTKATNSYYIWPVRGGAGMASGDWSQ